MTDSYGVFGFPVSHSLSPALHRAALDVVGLAGEYRLFPVQPLPEGKEMLVDVVDRLKVGELHGLNITIPHKQSVLDLVDLFAETAAAIQAVNTIYLKENQIIGENTDVPGFAAALQRAFDQDGFNAPSQGSAIILGAGGSARAVVYALIVDSIVTREPLTGALNGLGTKWYLDGRSIQDVALTDMLNMHEGNARFGTTAIDQDLKVFTGSVQALSKK